MIPGFRTRLAGALLAATMLLAGPARAGIPLPMWSTVDPALVLCPAGDVAFHVIPRRGTIPYPSSLLMVDFCDATGWAFEEAGQPAEIRFANGLCLPSVFADATGLATFALRAGGATTDSTVALYVDGVFFGHRFLASPDQNGDLLVNAADEAILAAKLGTNDLSADFDADGVVTENDRAILRAHLGHAASLPTPAAARSWGGLKIAYR